jgi:DNA-binding GntR family transcriptional regulator
MFVTSAALSTNTFAPENSGQRRTQLPDEVASYVRELILSGAVRPGDFLRMERISQAVGVSNTPVREGLLSLRSEGFVRLVPRRGFVVAPFTRQDVRDIYWAQAQLAGELAARAAKSMSAEQVRALAENLEDYERAVGAGDDERATALGHAFHREINKAAESPRLALLLGSVVSHVPNRFYTAIEGDAGSTRESHRLLVSALKRRQVRKARSLMEQHLLGGADRVIAILEGRGLWDDDDETDHQSAS